MPNLRQIVGLQEREPTVPPIRWFLGWLRDSKAKPGVSQIWATQNLNFPMSVASLGKIIQGKFLVFVYLIQCCWEVGREEIKTKKVMFNLRLQPLSSHYFMTELKSGFWSKVFKTGYCSSGFAPSTGSVELFFCLALHCGPLAWL